MQLFNWKAHRLDLEKSRLCLANKYESCISPFPGAKTSYWLPDFLQDTEVNILLSNLRKISKQKVFLKTETCLSTMCLMTSNRMMKLQESSSCIRGGILFWRIFQTKSNSCVYTCVWGMCVCVYILQPIQYTVACIPHASLGAKVQMVQDGGIGSCHQ